MRRAEACAQRNAPFRLIAQHAVEVFLGEIEEVGRMHDAGVVDEDVEAAEVRHRMVDQRLTIGP